MKTYLILANISIILLFYSIWQIKPVIVNVNDFLGLTSHLTIYYWIGLLLITLCSISVFRDSELKGDGIFIYILLITGLFLFGLGVFAEDNVRAWSSYYPIAEVKSILESGHVDITSIYPVISYRSFPAIHFISSFFLLLTKVDLVNMIKYMPLFWTILFILIIYCIGKRLTSSNSYAFMMSMLMISSFWQVYYYYSPQSYAYLLFLLLIFLLTTMKFSLRARILALLLFAALTISHLFYSVITISVMSIHAVQKKQYKFILVAFVIFVTWYMYVTPLIFEMGANKLAETVNNMDSSMLSQAQKYSYNTDINTQINSFRFMYPITYMILMLFSLILYRSGIIGKEKRCYIRTSFLMIIVITIFGLLKYGNEALERAYMFDMIFVITIIVLSFSNSNKNVLVAFMIILIGIHIPAHYGSESFLTVHTSELKGSEFIVSRINLSSLNTGVNTVYIYPSGGDRYISYYDPLLVTVRSRDTDFLELPNALDRVRYIIWGIHSSNLDMYYFGMDHIEKLLDSNKRNMDVTQIYDNGGLKVFDHKL
jgi:hypothetical protein